MGAWERENIGKPLAEATEAAAILSSLGIVAVGGGALLAAACLYWFWQIGETVIDKVGDAASSDSPWVPVISPAFWIGREISRRT